MKGYKKELVVCNKKHFYYIILVVMKNCLSAIYDVKILL